VITWSPSGEEDLVVRPLLLGFHAHLRAARLLRRVCPDALVWATESPTVRSYISEITSMTPERIRDCLAQFRWLVDEKIKQKGFRAP
jgi:hypothetical protein